VTRRRWIADEVEGKRAAITGAHAAHLARVLRARPGQEFDIATGESVHRGRITKISEQRVEFELGEQLSESPQPQVTLLLAIFKFDRMEWAIEKCTELGAAQIVPLIARRTDAGLAIAAKGRMERWRRLVRQAAEQSRRSAPPEISDPIKLKDAIASPADTRIVLAESEQEISLAAALRQHSRPGSLTLAIGPEGGWTADELQLFQQSSWKPASLGGNILRAETAAIAALAVVMSHIS